MRRTATLFVLCLLVLGASAVLLGRTVTAPRHDVGRYKRVEAAAALARRHPVRYTDDGGGGGGRRSLLPTAPPAEDAATAACTADDEAAAHVRWGRAAACFDETGVVREAQMRALTTGICKTPDRAPPGVVLDNGAPCELAQSDTGCLCCPSANALRAFTHALALTYCTAEGA
jgi:hypothetical protein